MLSYLFLQGYSDLYQEQRANYSGLWKLNLGKSEFEGILPARLLKSIKVAQKQKELAPYMGYQESK